MDGSLQDGMHQVLQEWYDYMDQMHSLKPDMFGKGWVDVYAFMHVMKSLSHSVLAFKPGRVVSNTLWASG